MEKETATLEDLKRVLEEMEKKPWKRWI